MPDEIRHYISLNFIYSDKRRICRNKFFSFMSECLFTVPVKILISQYEVIWFATWKEIGKKKEFFKSQVPTMFMFMYLSIHFPKVHVDVWGPRVLCKISSNHITKKCWNLVPRQGNKQRKSKRYCPSPWKTFFNTDSTF